MKSSDIRVLQVSASDHRGGAARAAVRLHKALRELDVDSQMLVQENSIREPSIQGASKWAARLRPYIDQVPLVFYRNRSIRPFSTTWFSSEISEKINECNADIVHLHWINMGFFHPRSLARIRAPVVWTMHDSWPFTGGCHVPRECLGYRAACGRCPTLGSGLSIDLSRWLHKRKRKHYNHHNLHLVVPSRWLADCASSSSLFRNKAVEVIANPLNLERFRPFPKKLARERLGLPVGKRLLLFGALGADRDTNKGLSHLRSALTHLSRVKGSLPFELALFGTATTGLDLPAVTHALGHLHDDITLAMAYSAADAMCVPSEQESFGQTASEALACGTPVVSFAATGLLDIVDHKRNGYLARAYDAVDLATGITYLLSRPQAPRRKMAIEAQKKARAFASERIAKQYLDLYTRAITAV